MDERGRQKGPIAVYGATGYTGRLVAAELDRAGVDFRLAGRNRQKLDSLAAGLDFEGRCARRLARRPAGPERPAHRLRGGDRLRRAFPPPWRAGDAGRRRDRDPLPRHHRGAALHAPGLGALRPPREGRRRGGDPGDGLRLRAGGHDRRADRLRNGQARHPAAGLQGEDAADPRNDALGPGDDQGWRRRVA